ncbi:hypothetical protein ACFL09_05175, partial [Planctomycetota bacterium]
MRKPLWARDLIVLIVVSCVLVVVVGGLVPVSCARARVEARRIRCRNNLNSLAKCMATYVHEHGGGRWYPFPLGRGTRPDDFNGAEWLASVYWCGVLIEPRVFLCPSTRDTHQGGRDVGTRRAIPGRFGSQTVSYAGMHYRSLTAADGRPTPGAIPDELPPNMPMASDDTQGSINHGRAGNSGMAVLFFDSQRLRDLGFAAVAAPDASTTLDAYIEAIEAEERRSSEAAATAIAELKELSQRRHQVELVLGHWEEQL